MLSNRQLDSIGASYVFNLLEPCSPYGAELARKPHFYSESEHDELTQELEHVRKLALALNERSEAFVRTERALMQLKDVRRSVEKSVEFKLSTDAARSSSSERSEGVELGDVELFELKRFLIRLETLVPCYRQLCPGGLYGIEINAFTEALDIIDPDGMRALIFRISDRCSEEIAHIRAERRRVDLALRNANAGEKDGLIAERTLLIAREEAEEARLRADMTRRLGSYAESILVTISGIAKLDFAMAKTRLLVKYGGSIPKVLAISSELSLKAMVNPQVAAALNEKGRSFTPVDIMLNTGSAVITGANMGGKSVAVKALALNVYLALCGLPVFCEEATIPHFSDIHLISEDMEDSQGGLSSFGGEMVQFDRILRSCEEKGLSLVLLDEFARGTNPHEGAALVRAAVRYFNRDAHTIALITTHFDDVAKFAAMHYQVMGLRNADRDALSAALSGGGEGKARVLERFMDYGLYPASSDANPPRDALTICHALGVRQEFMNLVESNQ
ncbi:MAG: hypothetical protein J1E60_05575 [Christensenellaceae bacterium]|nr:hypothetical protein [Christensenellaceae bacterium]